MHREPYNKTPTTCNHLLEINTSSAFVEYTYVRTILGSSAIPTPIPHFPQRGVGELGNKNFPSSIVHSAPGDVDAPLRLEHTSLLKVQTSAVRR